MNDFIGVLVLYKVNLNASESFKSLEDALRADGAILDLIIYDNSPEFQEFKANEHPCFNITYIHDPENPGVSKAYNVAAGVGIEKGKKWLILFDQDTTFPVNIFREYFNAIGKFRSETLFAPIMYANQQVISPCKFIFNRGFGSRDRAHGIRGIQRQSLINCGVCIKIASFVKVGGYNEDFRLDYSDHDFFHRFKKEVGTNVVIVNCEVEHSLSARQQNSLSSDKSRFLYFKSALLLFADLHGGRVYALLNILLRCVKLCLTHRTAVFLKLLRYEV